MNLEKKLLKSLRELQKLSHNSVFSELKLFSNKSNKCHSQTVARMQLFELRRFLKKLRKKFRKIELKIQLINQIADLLAEEGYDFFDNELMRLKSEYPFALGILRRKESLLSFIKERREKLKRLEKRVEAEQRSNVERRMK